MGRYKSGLTTDEKRRLCYLRRKLRELDEKEERAKRSINRIIHTAFKLQREQMMGEIEAYEFRMKYFQKETYG